MPISRWIACLLNGHSASDWSLTDSDGEGEEEEASDEELLLSSTMLFIPLDSQGTESKEDEAMEEDGQAWVFDETTGFSRYEQCG